VISGKDTEMTVGITVAPVIQIIIKPVNDE